MNYPMNYIVNKYMLVAVTVIMAVGAFGLPAHAQYYAGTPSYANPYTNNNSYNRTYYNAPATYAPATYAQSNYYGQPNYNNQYYTQPNYYTPLGVTCSANAQSVGTGSNVTWTAYPSGGTGYYTYSWTGTDGLYSSNQTANFTYSTAGDKTASVTVYSNGQSVRQYCSNTVNVYYGYGGYSTGYSNNNYPVTYPVVNQPIVLAAPNSGLDIGCYSDPMNAAINQPVTWNVEVTGGAGPYIYSWTGSDGITGSQSSSIKYYSKTGTKSAIVTVTSADGRTASRACSNALTVGKTKSYVATKSAPAVKATTQSNSAVAPQASNNGQAAASLLSLSNVPWGWIAILIILVLFFTVMYLLFNKQKI